ncbi:MAG: ATP-binding protein [bacterium]|nr:ATP-binding protein [bacterium]
MAEPTSLPPDAAFPLDAVVGHEEAKLALRLAALDPLIGGVLLRGEKGSAKTTLARGLAAELGQAPFVELPLGATEDRVVGTLDTRAALTGGEIRFQPGLLAAAHGGVLYVDEINLLADHLVDILLDVAVSGRNVVERDGLSHRHPARFVLVGSMNPEEGELRPQLLDRFGLCVGVAAPTLLPERVEAVRRRLRFDRGQPAVAARSGTGWDGSAAVDSSAIDDTLVEAASRLALAVAAEGLRADLTLCRAAAALAAGTRGSAPEVEDLRRVAPLVLAHRSRRSPFDPPMIPPEALEQAMDESLHADADAGSSGKADIGERGSGPGGRDDDASRPGADRPIVVGSLRRPPAPSPHARRSASTDRGRRVSDRVAEPGDAVALGPTLRALAWRQSSISDAIGEADLRAVVRHQPRKQAIVMCVDLSGSMGASERAAAASGTVLGLLTSAYEQRCAVALVTFRGGSRGGGRGAHDQRRGGPQSARRVCHRRYDAAGRRPGQGLRGCQTGDGRRLPGRARGAHRRPSDRRARHRRGTRGRTADRGLRHRRARRRLRNRPDPLGPGPVAGRGDGGATRPCERPRPELGHHRCP